MCSAAPEKWATLQQVACNASNAGSGSGSSGFSVESVMKSRMRTGRLKVKYKTLYWCGLSGYVVTQYPVSVVDEKVAIPTHYCFKAECQSIKILVHITLHCHDISQGMNLSPIESRNIASEPLENGQYGSRILQLDV